MIGKTVNYILVAFFVIVITITYPAKSSMAKTLENQEKALKIISSFADRFCRKIPLKGKDDQLELSGDAKIEVSKLIKLIADLKIEGAAKYMEKSYEGVLQKDLVEVLKNNVSCRLEIWKDLSDKLLIKHIPPDKVRPTVGGMLQTVNRSNGNNGKILTRYINKEFMEALSRSNLISPQSNNFTFIIKIIIDDVTVEKSSYETGSEVRYGVKITPTIIIQIIQKNNHKTIYKKYHSVTKSYFKDNYTQNKTAKYKELAKLLVKKIRVNQLIKVAMK